MWARHFFFAWCAIHSAILLAACQPARVADPKDAVLSYQRACSNGDAEALYAMLSERARSEISLADFKSKIAEERHELAAMAKSFSVSDSTVTANATIILPEGDEIAFALKDGRFRIASAGTMPGGAASPEEAARQLRRVLIRKSYAGLLSLLTPATRHALERDLATLIAGLDHPETLRITVVGESATILIPGGHQVRAQRSGGVWHIEDFD